MNIPTTSAGTEKPDPIFAAIEAHRLTQSRIEVFCNRPRGCETPDDERALLELMTEETNLLYAILDISPTSAAAVAAALAHIGDYAYQGHQYPSRDINLEIDLAPRLHSMWNAGYVEFETDALRWAARQLTRLALRPLMTARRKKTGVSLSEMLEERRRIIAELTAAGKATGDIPDDHPLHEEWTELELAFVGVPVTSSEEAATALSTVLETYSESNPPDSSSLATMNNALLEAAIGYLKGHAAMPPTHR